MDYQFMPPLAALFLVPHIIPYAIIGLNFIFFTLLRSFVNKILANYSIEAKQTKKKQQESNYNYYRKLRLIKLFIDELISTCELCADCAELNVVYERHGSLAYGATLFLLSYLWIDTFGDAQTTPGYLIEDYFLVNGNQMLKTGDAYARFLGQSMAVPLAWRFASLYWSYKLLSEHKEMLLSENCKSSLTTSTLNGFFIEFVCCLICRLLELIGHKLLERKKFSQRIVSLTSSFTCTLLVVLALELSGGYFNPVLAASLEYGCKGIQFYQHALVFWLGPLAGHLLARSLFKRFGGEKVGSQIKRDRANRKREDEGSGKASRLTRSSSQKKIRD